MIDVYTDVVGGEYARVTPYRVGDAVPLQRFPDVQVAVGEVIR